VGRGLLSMKRIESPFGGADEGWLYAYCGRIGGAEDRIEDGGWELVRERSGLELLT